MPYMCFVKNNFCIDQTVINLFNVKFLFTHLVILVTRINLTKIEIFLRKNVCSIINNLK